MPGTVFFLSDYGLVDEFVGVVHAVLRRLAPAATVVDLTHQIPPYDVRAGAAALVRAFPHLGPGVVLAVVDPGVGGPRRGLALQVDGPGPRWLVGPDNGLLLPAARQAGGIRQAFTLDRAAIDTALDRAVAEDDPATFDGRDLFAPAAARLVTGADPGTLGTPMPAAHLVRVPEPVVEAGTLADGRRVVRAEVTWVDRFGNVQLGATGNAVPASVTRVVVSVPVPGEAAGAGLVQVRRVRTFSDLSPDEPGLLSDGNGQLALVVREGSAATHLGLLAGHLVELFW